MSIDLIPIWGVFVGTIVMVMISIELGYQTGNMTQRRQRGEKETAVSAVTGVILGFSAFMLAFTFSFVWERYDAKRALVCEDAVAIRTVWKRSDFLPAADRAETAALLREYVDIRLKFAEEENLDPEHVAATAANVERIQDRLWEIGVANARSDMSSDVVALYIDSLNVMTGIHALRRVVGLQARVPIEIWAVLFFVTLLGMFVIGIQTGIADSQRSVTWPIVALTFALGFTLIASLDRPDSGILNVSQRPLMDLRNSMALRSAAPQ